MTEQKEKGYQGIWAIEAFEYENTRSDFKYCHYWQNKKLCQPLGILETQGAFSNKIPWDIDGATDEIVLQSDVQAVENIVVYDSK